MKLSQNQVRRLAGFGGGCAADSYMLACSTPESVIAALDLARVEAKQVVLRGNGRSYGDAAILSEAVAVNLSAERDDFLISGDVLEAHAGLRLRDLYPAVLNSGFWLPVVSGTAEPTLAGCLAMNIHGKNAYTAGTICKNVEWVEVVFPSGEFRRIQNTDPDFGWIAGSWGLLGVFTRCGIRLHHIDHNQLDVKPIVARNWTEHFDAFASETPTADYAVSWVDLFTMGRGLLHSARYSNQFSPGTPPHERTPGLVKKHLWRALKLFTNPSGMRLINSAKLLAARFERAQTQYIPDFHFLLDSLPNWQHAYGSRGFLQFQVFAPIDSAPSLFAQLNQAQHDAGFIAFLGVMKQHKSAGIPMDYSVDGFSLAMDFPNLESTRFKELLRRMIDMTLDHGGKFYFAKDQVLEPKDVLRQFGREKLEAFQAKKQQFDPEGLLTSALDKRLLLTNPSILRL